MKTIKLTQGQQTQVDDDDYEWLNSYNWCCMYTGKPYAVRGKQYRKKKRTIKMAGEIMQPPDGMVIDHIDGNSLNNQKSNLRICTPQQNSVNRKAHHGGSSQYIGVSWDRHAHKWVAQFMFKGKQMHLGYFKDEEKAAKIRDQKVFELLGKFAYLNFPNEKGILNEHD